MENLVSTRQLWVRVAAAIFATKKSGLASTDVSRLIGTAVKEVYQKNLVPLLTELRLASSNGDLEVVQKIIRAEFKDQPYFRLCYAIHNAIEYGHLHIIKWVIDYLIDNPLGWLPNLLERLPHYVSYAKYIGQPEIAKYLQECSHLQTSK